MRGRTLATAAIALTAFGPAACGNSGVDSTPQACLGGAGAFQQALVAAPAEVTLAGGDTKISDCLVEGQSGGELATTGEGMVRTATLLNNAAREHPERTAAAVELGYLVGAAERGAKGTSGIHTDLLRRLSTAAEFSPGSSPAPEFEKPYSEGLAAGRASG